jgi:hypothetical protein
VAREGFVEFIRTWTEQFENWSIRVESWIDAGENRVVALTHQSATGRGSGVPVELNLGQVWEWEAGRLARGSPSADFRGQVLAGPAGVLRAVGVVFATQVAVATVEELEHLGYVGRPLDAVADDG